MLWPVTWLAASESRKAATSASSSAWPTRPWGTKAASWSQRFVRQRLEQRRLDEAGDDAVAADPVRRRLERDRAGKAEHAMLGGDIGDIVGHAALAGEAAGDEDRAAPPLDHAGQDVPDGAEDAGEVDPQQRLEIRIVIFGGGRKAAAGAGIGEQAVDRAEGGLGLVERGGQGIAVGDVGGGVASGLADLPGRLAQLVLAARDQGDAGAAPGEQAGGGAADPGRAAGDDDVATVEAEQAEAAHPSFSRRAAFSLRISGITSSRKPTLTASFIHRSGLISGKSEPNSIFRRSWVFA